MGPSPSRILVITALVVVGTLLPACDPTDLDPADDADQFSAPSVAPIDKRPTRPSISGTCAFGNGTQTS